MADLTLPAPDVVLICAQQDGQWLVIRRPAASRAGGLWGFPGGKLDPGESLEQAAMREGFEELGVGLVVVASGVVHHIAEYGVQVQAVLVVLEDAPLVPSTLEVAEVAWRTEDDLRSDPEVLRSTLLAIDDLTD